MEKQSMMCPELKEFSNKSIRLRPKPRRTRSGNPRTPQVKNFSQRQQTNSPTISPPRTRHSRIRPQNPLNPVIVRNNRGKNNYQPNVTNPRILQASKHDDISSSDNESESDLVMIPVSDKVEKDFTFPEGKKSNIRSMSIEKADNQQPQLNSHPRPRSTHQSHRSRSTQPRPTQPPIVQPSPAPLSPSLPESLQENSQEILEKVELANDKIDEFQSKTNNLQNLSAFTISPFAYSHIVTFSIVRVVCRSGFSKKYMYLFNLNSNLLLKAQANNRYPVHPIPIEKGESETETNLFHLTPNSKHSLFFLSNGNTTLLSLTLRVDPILPGTRNFEVSIPSNIDGMIVLVNRKPEVSRTGQHVLDFHHKLTLPSVKNCIFIRSGEHKDVLALRKISESSFEIDSYSNLHPLFVFAISLICCIAKLR